MQLNVTLAISSSLYISRIPLGCLRPQAPQTFAAGCCGEEGFLAHGRGRGRGACHQPAPVPAEVCAESAVETPLRLALSETSGPRGPQDSGEL